MGSYLDCEWEDNTRNGNKGIDLWILINVWFSIIVCNRSSTSDLFYMITPLGWHPLEAHLHSGLSVITSLSPSLDMDLVWGAPVMGAELCTSLPCRTARKGHFVTFSLPWRDAWKGHLEVLAAAPDDGFVKVGWTEWKKRSEKKFR